MKNAMFYGILPARHFFLTYRSSESVCVRNDFRLRQKNCLLQKINQSEKNVHKSWKKIQHLFRLNEAKISIFFFLFASLGKKIANVSKHS